MTLRIPREKPFANTVIHAVMKRIYFYLLLTCIGFSISPYKAAATHAAGGEIAYEWIADSTYRVYFKFYRDCGGSTEAPNITLCYKNECTGTNYSQPLSKLTGKLPDSTVNGSPVSTGCPSVGTRCTNSSSIVSSYREWWYVNTVTLPARCSLWRFSVFIGDRNSSMNLQNTSAKAFYVEATLNNVIAQGNSSPFFSVKPVPSVCVNKPYTYNNGAVDPNSDSLTFEMNQPLYKVSSMASCSTPVIPLPFAFGLPAYNLINNPIQTNNTFHLDSSTGQMTFIPSAIGAGTMTMKVNEYRNGVLIGSVMRDVQVQVMNCNVASPIVSTVSGTLMGATYTNGRVEACAGTAMSFCFDLKSPDTAAIIVASDNHNAAAPGSSVNYAGQRTDSVRGCLTWTPSTLDTGLRVFSVTAKDSTCIAPGMIIAQTFVLPIYIWPVTDIIKDTTICAGDSVQLLAVGGSVFTWSVMPGGSALTTLSCTNCKQPYAKPGVTTKYIVSNSSISYCAKNRDTVTVNVTDYTAIDPLAASNTPVCSGDTIFLTSKIPAGFAIRWTGPSGFVSSMQDTAIANAHSGRIGNYIVKGIKNGCATASDTISVLVKPTPFLFSPNYNAPLCAGKDLNLTTASVSGAIFTWTGPNSFTANAQYPSIQGVTSLNAGKYYVQATVDGCSSDRDSINVVVHSNPPAPVVTTPVQYCRNDVAVPLSASGNNLLWYTQAAGGNGSAVAPVPFTATGGTTSWWVTQRDANNCESPRSEVIVHVVDYTGIVPAASSNSPVCQGDTIVLTSSLPAGFSISWAGPGGFSSANPDNKIYNAQPGQGGNYIVTGKKDGCITSAAIVNVTVNPTPVIFQTGNNGPLCTGRDLLLTTGAVTNAVYSWMGPNSFTANTRTPIVSPVALANAGKYYVQATVNGCKSAIDSTSVTVNANPLAPVAASPLKYCRNDVALPLSAAGNGLLWYTQATGGTGTSVTPVPSTATGGTTLWWVTQTDANNCESPRTPVTVNVTDYTGITPAASGNSPVCSGDTIVLSAIMPAGFTPGWSGPGGFSSHSADTFIYNAQVAHSGNYMIKGVKDGCSTSAGLVSIVVNQTPLLSQTGSNAPLCIGKTLNLKTTSNVPGATYLWNGPGSFTSGAQTPSVLNVTASNAGRYYVIAVSNGCFSAIDSLEVVIYSNPPTPVASSPVQYCRYAAASSLAAAGDNLLWYTTPAGGTGSATAPIPATTATGSFSWWVTQTDVNGCESLREPVTVKIVQPLPPVVSTTVEYCQFAGTNALNAAGSGLKWYVQASGGVLLPAAPVPSSALPGNYAWWVSQTSSDGCESERAAASVIIHPKPAPPAVTDSTWYCWGDAASPLTANGQGLRWYESPTGISWSVTPPVPGTNNSGIRYFYVSQVINNCESDRAAMAIVTRPKITADILTEKDSICGNDTLMLSNSAANPAGSGYSWDFAGGTIISGAGEGPYEVSWKDRGAKKLNLTITLGNCTTSASRDIFVLQIPNAIFELKDNACAGQKLELKPYWDYTNITNYVWSFDNGIIADTTKYNTYNIYWANPGEKNVALITTGRNGCIAKRSHIIQVHDKPSAKINMVNPAELCAGDIIPVSTEYNSAYAYQWSPVKNFPDADNSSEVMAIIPKAGVLGVVVTDSWGCEGADSVYVNTKSCCEVYLPDAFTPNNDGRNDRFRIITSGHHTILAYVIRNRWGQEIFRTGNIGEGWDGTFKGTPQDPGIYHYYIKYRCADNNVIERKGEFALIR